MSPSFFFHRSRTTNHCGWLVNEGRKEQQQKREEENGRWKIRDKLLSPFPLRERERLNSDLLSNDMQVSIRLLCSSHDSSHSTTQTLTIFE